MKKIIRILAVAACITAAGYAGYRFLNKPVAASTAAVKTATVSRGSLQVSIAGAGSVSAQSSTNAGFRVSGEVKSVNVRLGDSVQAGQVLAEMDDADLQLSVATAETNLLSAQANYRSLANGLTEEERKLAELTLQEAADALKDAQAAYDAVSWRPDIGMLPQSTALETATRNYEKAKLTYAETVRGATQDQLAVAQAQVEQAQASLDQARQSLGQAQLLAPLSGTVTAVNIAEGDYVSANSAAFTVVDLSKLQVVVPLAEMDVPSVKAGQSVAITLDALPGLTLSGKVTYVPPVATISSGVVSYPVQIEIEKSAPSVLVGMTASVSIVVDSREDVLLIPNRAVHTSGKQRSVQVLADGQTRDVAVTLGVSNDSYTEVLSGVSEGDVVVLRTSSTSTTSTAGQLGGLGGMLGGEPAPATR